MFFKRRAGSSDTSAISSRAKVLNCLNLLNTSQERRRRRQPEQQQQQQQQQQQKERQRLCIIYGYYILCMPPIYYVYIKLEIIKEPLGG